MTFSEWYKTKIFRDDTLVEPMRLAYEAGQKSIACCGACVHWNNISTDGQLWVCVYNDNGYAILGKTVSSLPCEYFEPRRKK